MSALPARTSHQASSRDSFLSPDSANGLFRLIGQTEMVSRGQAMLVSLGPVKTALAERWPQRRSQVYDVAESHFRKHLSATGIWSRASETHFLVATPDKTTEAAKELCCRALKEVLVYILGEAQPEDLQIALVTELTENHVEASAFTAAELGEISADASLAKATLTPPATAAVRASPLTSLTSWPMKTADGQDLRVSFAVDPVMDLKAWAMAGHRIESRIVNLHTLVELTPGQRRSLLPPDFEKVDLAALDRGMSRLAGAEIPDRPKLIIQVSFASLSNARARAALLDRASELRSVLSQGAICELVDVETGIPVSRLTEITSMVRGFFRSVWVQIDPSRTMVDTAAAAKVSGLTIPASLLGDDPQGIADGMRKFVPMVRRPNTMIVVTSLPTTDLMIDAMAAGFTHATLRARTAATADDPNTPQEVLL